MPKTREGYASAPQSRPRVAPMRAPLDAPPYLPDSAPQRRYHTRRAAATPVAPTQIPPRNPPTKKAKTSEPGESSRAPRDSQAFHVEAYFDHSILRQQPELGDSYRLLERYHLVPFMTLPQFFYPRVALDFYQSMTTLGVPVPASILFTIDGRQGILGARQIAEAFHIPFAPADPTAFRRWAPLSKWDMVRILSRGTSSQRIIMRKELPSGMLLVDVALFRISEGYYFGPHHLIMPTFLHFEEKVHKRRLTRVDTILLLFPRLLCHVLAHMGFPSDPHSEPRRHCQESFSLDQWNQVSLHQHSPELPEPGEVLSQPLPSISAPPTSAPSEPVPEAASSDAPPAVPPTSKPPITIPGAEYRDLLASFQTLTTTQTTIMERMDHF
uniref:Uncharacterized protein n=1 Tax=Vitis vinifera TaxID=29760 RepID=A5AZA9_VITVI|nr:hypothetical protein VITISV_006691 [Vitis vinifera]